jgi:3-isopropylmalate dehydrogenase
MLMRIAVLPGDGVGPEVIEQAVRVLAAVARMHGYRFDFEECAIGGAAIAQTGTPLPPTTLEACRKADAVLLGAVGAPQYDALPPDRRPEAGLLGLRKSLGGFANLRPCVAYDVLLDCSPLRREVVRGADVLVVRELLGGLYFSEPRGFTADGHSAHNTLNYTAAEVERIARIGFDAAMKRRRRVTSVDKANVLETSQLWRRVVNAVALDYPEVVLDHQYVDSAAMRLVTAPTSFDVLLTENLFGDILSDEAAAISGSLGMMASATVGGDVDLYEPVHGSAPDIAGHSIANPLGAIASAAMLLRHSAGLEQEARDVETAIRDVLRDGWRTRDIAARNRDYLTTSEMGEQVEQALHAAVDRRHAYHAV